MSIGEEDCKQQPGPQVESSFSRVLRQRRALDECLISIKGYSDESRVARTFIVGQIDALDWAISMFEVR